MTPDPLTQAVVTAAVEGVVGSAVQVAAPPLLKRLAGVASPVIRRVFASAEGRSRAVAAERTGRFVGRLASELQASLGLSGEISDPSAERAIVEQLGDPDVVATIESAVATAARTDSRERHAALVKSVAARLNAPADSARAIVASVAVDALARLGREHLEVLGVIALVRHVGRLPVVNVPPEIRQRYAADQEETHQPALDALRPIAREQAGVFAERLARLSERHAVGRHATRADALHLDSVGCIVAEARGPRFSHAIMAPDPTPVQGSDHLLHLLQLWCSQFVEERLAALPAGAKLLDTWDASLSALAPTPVGLLIGLAVHDTATGEQRARDSEWAPADRRPWVAEDV